MQTTTKEIFCYNPPPPTPTPFPLIFFTFPEFRGLYKQKIKKRLKYLPIKNIALVSTVVHGPLVL